MKMILVNGDVDPIAITNCAMSVYLFFFQAEDGIRDYKVTGVQTCALPILRGPIRHRVPRPLRRVRFIDVDLGIDNGHRGAPVEYTVSLYAHRAGTPNLRDQDRKSVV